VDTLLALLIELVFVLPEKAVKDPYLRKGQAHALVLELLLRLFFKKGIYL
jgi:hypothetical protein